MDDETPRQNENSPTHEGQGSLRRPPLYPAELWAHKGFSVDPDGERSEYVAPISRYLRVNGKKRARPEYAALRDAVQRCTNPNNHAFDRYGGRGIRVCRRWSGPNGFDYFYADMGPRPEGHSLDRIDNDGDYEPDNCRWTTTSRQNRNTRVNKRITVDGETMCVTAWAERTGLGRTTINNRLRAGWSPDDAVKTPPGGRPRVQLGVPKRCSVCGEQGHYRTTCEAA